MFSTEGQKFNMLVDWKTFPNAELPGDILLLTDQQNDSQDIKIILTIAQ